ncbi:MAG: hypothetical protein JNK99_15495 [Candidatus Accumulibacter sp.]|uniref:hypothetical protein n=1 Tax=Accumulibacter sp. TaxID=2053492 RepID=UPI001A3A1BE7|nr:hypothetical protein [Accumulibacter sp.]MBL8396124.1 hypothetical protein [Accumulibacter sp.]
MNREEVRDQLLAPVLQWIRVGRQTNRLMIRSMEVIGQRSNRLLRGTTLREKHDWGEMGAMTREKVAVPLEAVVAMSSAMQSEAQQFLAEGSQATLAVVGSAADLAASRSTDEFRTRQAALGEAMLGVALCWYQLWGRTAEVVGQGLRPILRQVEDNANRLGTR